VATDGNQIDSISDVHYVIVNAGERYDVIVNANQDIGNYWILAETLETEGGTTFYNPINTHKAEAILHYDGAPAYNNSEFSDQSRSWNCSEISCSFVNCPYKSPYTECINVDEFKDSLGKDIDEAIYDNNIKTLFYNFGFDGEKTTRGSSVDGINFRLPTVLPFTTSFESSKQACQGRGCDHKVTNYCACTHVIDINDVSEGQAVELVMTNYLGIDAVDDDGKPLRPESSHPIHLHGHSFYVVKIGYPEYNDTGHYVSRNLDIDCIVNNNESQSCEKFITVTGDNAQTVKWNNDERPEDLNYRNKCFAQKDTVIIPFGGYTVIRFIVDNPGWWFLHCHIEIHQLEGMAAVVNELQSKQPKLGDTQGQGNQQGNGQGKK